MNKMNKLWLLCFSCCALIFSACGDDSPMPTPATAARGVLLVNQGNFTSGNGSVDRYDPESQGIEQSVYRKINGEPVNGSIESVNIDDDMLVVLVNQNGGPGKVIFADAATLAKEEEQLSEANLYSPRYAAFSQEHVFVSVWGAFDASYQLQNSSIAVFNRSTRQLEKNIAVPAGPEGILIDGANLWVANSFTDTITIINTATLEVAQKFRSVAGPAKLEKAADGKVWMMAGDTLSRYNAATFALEKKVKLPGSATKWQFVGNTLYFLTQAWSDDYSSTFNKLYTLDISQDATQPQLYLEKDNARIFWVNPENSELYLGVAAGADPGTLLRLDADGTELDREPAGVFPHQIIEQ